MTKPSRSSPRGNGRAAFISRLDTIRAEIAAGEYLTTIYARHADALGITYSGFRKLVARYADDAKPVARRAYGSGRAPSVPTPAPPPPLLPAPPRPAATPASPGAPAHARHEPPHAPRRTFVYDGNPRADDIARLITGTNPVRKE